MTVKDLLTAVFPWSGLISANRTLRNKINRIAQAEGEPPLDYMQGYAALSIDDLKKLYADTLTVKGTLESKLQAFLFSIAIGVTVLSSSLAFIYGDAFSSFPIWLKAASLLLLTAAISFMLLGGFFAIRTIGGQITIYIQSTADLAAGPETCKRTLAVNTELNSITNIVRQNFMNVSFNCILNALCAVFVFFLLVGCHAIVGKRPPGTKAVEVKIIPLAGDISNLQKRIDGYVHAQDRLNQKIKSDVDSLVVGSASASGAISTMESLIVEATNRIADLSTRAKLLEAHYAQLASSSPPQSASPTPPP